MFTALKSVPDSSTLVFAKVELSGTDFSAVNIQSISVNAPEGSTTNGSISFKIDGVEYKSSATIGSKLGANQTYQFTSVTDPNKVLSFTTGESTIDFSTQEKADAFRNALLNAFGATNGAADLKFQVGVTTADTLSVGIDNISTNRLFGGKTLDVLTQDNAATASDALDAAIKTVTSVRAEVGALQSRFNYASANIQSAIQNQDAARGSLLDTDVASESTAYATAQVQLQAGISVLAQANQLPQNLLKLLS